MSLLHQPATLPLVAFAGLAVGWLLVRLYNRLPESWLQDYGFRANDPEWPAARRIRSPIGMAVLMAVTSLGFILAILGSGLSVRTLLVILSFCILVLVAVPDALNKIIPDQATIALALVGALFAAVDLFTGRGIRETAIDRIGGAAVAGGLLLLIGVSATFLLKREAMGMGDVKLLFACGLLTGLRLVPLLYFATFVSAALIAVPISIRERRIQAEMPQPEEESDEESSDSVATAQTPLGPFIAAACYLCLVAGDAVSDLLFPYLAFL